MIKTRTSKLLEGGVRRHSLFRLRARLLGIACQFLPLVLPNGLTKIQGLV